MKVAYNIALFNPEKKLIRELSGKCNSLLKNYYLMFYAHLVGESVTVTRTDGSNRTYNYPPHAECKWPDSPPPSIPNVFGVAAGSENESYGILIGTSDAPVTPDDYDLDARFSCYVSSTDVSDVFIEAGSISLTVARTFLNNNVDAVIKEFGLVAEVWGVGYLLILRETIAPVDFPLDYSLRIKMNFSF